MQYLLFEDFSHHDLLPLCYTRPVFALRAGIFTMQERWEKTLGQRCGTIAHDYLGEKYNLLPDCSGMVIAVNGKFVPDADFVRLLAEIPENTAFIHRQGELLAAKLPSNQLDWLADFAQTQTLPDFLKTQTLEKDFEAIRKLPDIFQKNKSLIQYDFALVTATAKSAAIDDRHTIVYGKDNIFVEEGVKFRASILNAEDGLMYFGKGVDVQEGSLIHGSHAFGDFATVNMGAKLRGDSAFGPYVKVGGEVGNSVIMGYSNKGHDGYMGNSVLGYWCNWGADTNSSNLKNTYEEVKLWSYRSQRFEKTGSQFCGLIMGDHAKCGINTMFNTGTVVGVSANVFGEGFPRNFIPDFSWGGANGLSTYQLRKAFQTCEAVMSRRKVAFDGVEQRILQKVYELSAPLRNWEKSEQH